MAVEVTRLSSALRDAEDDDAELKLNAALAVIDGIGPENEIEAMLASEMAVTHALIMKLIGRARLSSHDAQLENAGNMAIKLMRTFTAQTEALAKLRRGGEQTVRVEHVHIHPGSQAIVGNVNHSEVPGMGGGLKK